MAGLGSGIVRALFLRGVVFGDEAIIREYPGQVNQKSNV
jgi:hypothetical protein